MKTTHVPSPGAFALAIGAARKAMRMNQTQFARCFNVCRQTIARWEVTTTKPQTDTELIVMAGLAKLPASIRLDILASLDETPPAPPPVAAPAPAPRDTRAEMELVIYRTAEALDVGARGMRTAVEAVLREMDRVGLSLKEGLEALGAGGRREEAGGATQGSSSQ